MSQDTYGRTLVQRPVTAAMVTAALWMGLALPARAEYPAPQPASLATEPMPPSPGLDLRQVPPSQPESKSIVRTWWFWTAVGAVAATTIVLVAVANRDSTPPSSLLGNQDFQP